MAPSYLQVGSANPSIEVGLFLNSVPTTLYGSSGILFAPKHPQWSWGGGTLSWNLVWFQSIDRIVLFSVLLTVWRYQWVIKYIGVCQYYMTWTNSLPLTGWQLEIKDWPVVLMEVKFFGLCFTYIFPHKTSAGVFGTCWKTECPADLVSYRGGFIFNAFLCQLVKKLDICGEGLHFSGRT